jgi:glucose/arabinose dehydrogenase
MRCSTLAVLAAAVITLSACGDSGPPTPSPPPSNGETIRGTERLGWDQVAADAAELTTFRFAIYVDGTRTEMADVNCGSNPAATGFPCSGRLPALTPGQHTLELATFIMEGTAVTESPRSAPLRVNVSSALVSTAAGLAMRRRQSVPPTSAPQVRVAAVSEGFDEITDVAIAGERLFVSERLGAVRVIDNAGVSPRPALIAGDAIVSLALDPAFERSRQVFVLQAGSGRGDELVLRLVRYREIEGTFGERAVILDNIPAAQDDPRGTLRFGPDGKLYLSSSRLVQDGGGSPAREGFVLRLERDGSTPSDQPAFDPVRVAGGGEVGAFDFQPRTSWVWIAERDGARERISRVPAERWPARQGVREAERQLPTGTRVSAMHFYRSDRMRTLMGALLVGSDAGLLAMRFDPRQPAQITALETLLEGRVRAVVSDAGGRLFVATGTSVMEIEPETR